MGQATSSPYSVTWNNVGAGFYRLTARATDNGGVSSTSSPVEIFVNTTGGALSGSVAFPAQAVDLTAEGTADWAHWGLVSSNSYDHKADVVQQIGNFTGIGTNAVQRYADNYTGYSWSDGTPTLSTNNSTTGVFIAGLTNGFQLSLPADPTSRTLNVYVGLYGAAGNLQAYLSDFSAPAYTDMSVSNFSGNAYAVYTLNYAAASAGQTLNIKYTSTTLFDQDFGNVTLQSATLAGPAVVDTPPTVTITTPTNNAAFTAMANVSIQADASNADGTISKVEFYSGTTLLGTVTNAPYAFNWSSVPTGNYTLTARATDNAGASTISGVVNISVANNTATAVTILNPMITGNDFAFSFATETGLTYTVQFTDSLNPTISWNMLTNFTGNGTAYTVTDTTAASQRFYRVGTQ